MVSGSPSERISYSALEVIHLTGIPRTALYRLLATGALKSFKVGRRRMIAAKDLNAFVDQRRAVAQGNRRARALA